MHSQVLCSILVWVAVLFSTHVVSDKMSDQLTLDVVNKLNMLVQHSGWQYMKDVQISKVYRGDFTAPISEMLEAISLKRKPVDEFNVLDRYKDIWTVLSCKYGVIIYNYKTLINNFILVCQSEKSTFDLFQKYYKCFDLLLIKLHSMSPRFKCMLAALGFISSLAPQLKFRQNIMEAAEKLAEYTLTVGPTTSSKLSEHGITVDSVDFEIKSINDFISEIYFKDISGFTYNYCNVPTHKKWATHTLVEEYRIARDNQLIPLETTVLEYVIDEIDSYVNEIFGKWFYDLGFVYGVEDTVTIGTN